MTQLYPSKLYTLPLKGGEGQYKLLKFWFAGCAPCKKQIPFENELVRKNKNLKLIHFCYSTDFKKWKEYIDANKSLCQHFYLDADTYEKYKAVFNLGYAPRYILLNKDNEIVCWECSNPNNKEIENQLLK